MKSVTLGILVGLLLTIAGAAHGSLLTLQPSAKQVEGVVAAAGGTVNLQGQAIALQPICAALRWKPILVAKVKAYVGQILATDASKFVRNEAQAIDSLNLSNTIVFHYTMLRNVDGSTLTKSFRDGLASNKIDMNLPHIKALVGAVQGGGDISNGGTMFAAIRKNADGTETLFYENQNGLVTEIQGPAGFSRDMIAIWLGIPADKGVASFKADCIAGK